MDNIPPNTQEATPLPPKNRRVGTREIITESGDYRGQDLRAAAIIGEHKESRFEGAIVGPHTSFASSNINPAYLDGVNIGDMEREQLPRSLHERWKNERALRAPTRQFYDTVATADNAALLALMEEGICFYARDERCNTPLHRIAACGREQLVDTAFRKGADLEARNAKGFTPFFEALVHNRTNAIMKLLARGASLCLESPHHAGLCGLHPWLRFASARSQDACDAFLQDKSLTSLKSMYEILSAWPLADAEHPASRTANIKALCALAEWKSEAARDHFIAQLRSKGEQEPLCDALQQMELKLRPTRRARDVNAVPQRR